MFFNPNTRFLLNPIPRSRRDSARTEGNATPVLESTTEAGVSFRESEPQSGSERLAKKKFSAFWRNGCVWFVRLVWETAATPANAAAPAATVSAAVVAEKGRDVAEEQVAGGGWENEKGKRKDTMVPAKREESGFFDSVTTIYSWHVDSTW